MNYDIRTQPAEHTLTLTKTCTITGQPYVLKVLETDWDNYQAGALVQVAFPNLTPEQREFIITGITPDEWNSFSGETDEDTDEDTLEDPTYTTDHDLESAAELDPSDRDFGAEPLCSCCGHRPAAVDDKCPTCWLPDASDQS